MTRRTPVIKKLQQHQLKQKKRKRKYLRILIFHLYQIKRRRALLEQLKDLQHTLLQRYLLEFNHLLLRQGIYGLWVESPKCHQVGQVNPHLYLIDLLWLDSLLRLLLLQGPSDAIGDCRCLWSTEMTFSALCHLVFHGCRTESTSRKFITGHSVTENVEEMV